MSYLESPSDLSGRSFGYGPLEPGLPRLRSDLIIRRQQYGPNELFYVVKDPISKEYFKLPPVQWELYSLFDGNHTEQQIIDEYAGKYPLETVDEEVIETAKQDLRGAGLLDVSSSEKNLMLMERIRTQRKLLLEKKNKWSLEYMIIWSVDPDQFLNRLVPHLRFLWSKTFFVVSMIAIVLMLAINIYKWDEFWQGTVAIYTFQDHSLWGIVVFFFLFTLSLSIHELGHALTMKYYGGECHQLGFMLFYLSPALFADAADAYMLEKRSDRIWFSLAGVYSEAILCCFATFVWFFTPPGTAVHDFAFLVFLFTGITGFLMNLNPLVRLDGYYILEDMVGIDGLREESFGFLGRWLKRNIFRLEVDEPVGMTKRKRRTFIIYGMLTLLYTVFIYLLIVLWIRNVCLEEFGQVGYLFLLLTLYLLFKKNLRDAFNFFKFVYLDKKEVLMKKRRSVAFALVGLAALLLIPKTHMKISSAFVVEPVERTEIRSKTDGFVDQVFVKENDSVQPGQILARLGNPELSEEDLRINSRLNIVNRELSMHASFGETTEHQMKLRLKEQLLREKNETAKKLQDLNLRSVIKGTVITPYIHEKVGAFVNQGDLFCVVADLNKVKVQIPVSEHGIDDVEVGQQVLLKLNAYPTETFEGKVLRISPAIVERVEAIEGTFTKFNVDVVIDNSNRQLAPGMSGDAKVLAKKYSIAGRIGRELYRGIKSTIW